MAVAGFGLDLIPGDTVITNPTLQQGPPGPQGPQGIRGLVLSLIHI